MIFVSSVLKKPALPMPPTGRPRQVAPSACTQSSISGRSCSAAIASSDSMSPGMPNVCCTRIARVRWPIELGHLVGVDVVVGEPAIGVDRLRAEVLDGVRDDDVRGQRDDHLVSLADAELAQDPEQRDPSRAEGDRVLGPHAARQLSLVALDRGAVDQAPRPCGERERAARVARGRRPAELRHPARGHSHL